MDTRRDVFQAIADPTRREIIGLITNKTMNLNDITGNFDVTRQAISQHIKILIECGLIEIKQQGRERYCEAKLAKLGEVLARVEQYKQFWSVQFKSLERYLTDVQNKKKHAKRKSGS